jgi:hypothetical protein
MYRGVAPNRTNIFSRLDNEAKASELTFLMEFWDRSLSSGLRKREETEARNKCERETNNKYNGLICHTK